MSHHLDSPLARKDPRLDLTDQYVFGTQGSTVLVMNANTSLARGPAGFHPKGRYEFKIHLDGASVEAITYRIGFDAPDECGEQSYRIERLAGRDATDDDAVGVLVARGRSGEEVTGPALRAWTGRAADPFYLDLSLLKAIGAAVQRGETVMFADRRPDFAVNSFAGSTIQSIVLELAHTDTELRPGRHIAVWSAAKLSTDSGGWRQVNRIGLPMIWPVFRRDDSAEASHANETHPAQDAVNYGAELATLVSTFVRRHDTAADPDAYAAAVIRRLIPDVLPYQVGRAASFGFAEFNGRAPADNAAEVMFSLVTNSAIPTGLTARRAAETRSLAFPYVVPC